MKALVAYMLAGVVLVGVGVAVLGRVFGPEAGSAIRWAAVLACGVQAVAFAALVAVRRRGVAFMAAWVGGTLLRMVVVLVAGVWLTRSASLPAAPLLLSLAGFLFLLLVMEPVFFRVGMRSR